MSKRIYSSDTRNRMKQYKNMMVQKSCCEPVSIEMDSLVTPSFSFLNRHHLH